MKTIAFCISLLISCTFGSLSKALDLGIEPELQVPPLLPNVFGSGGRSAGASVNTIFFHNKCDVPIYTAIRYLVGSDFETHGWWLIEPSQKATVANTKGRNIYVYAESKSKKEDRLYWSGEGYYYTIRKSDEMYGFFHVDTGPSFVNHTQSFTC